MSIFIVLVIGIIFYIVQDVIYKKLWDSGLSAEISITPSSVYEGDDITITEKVENKKIIPLPWIWVKFSVDNSLAFDDRVGVVKTDNNYRNDVFYILGYQRLQRKLKCCCSRRGYYRVKGAKVICCNIFYTNKLEMQAKASNSVTVYPRLIDSDDIDGLFTKITGEAIAKSFVNTDPFEFVGIREYQPYDSFKSINFNASAKLNELMVNVNAPTMQKEILIFIDFEVMDARTDDELWEESIRLAATIANHYIESGFSVGLTTNGEDMLTNENKNVGLGVGNIALESINETLARLNTAKRGEIAIDEIKKSEAMILYISSCYDKNMLQKMVSIRSEGGDVQWILPIMYYDVHKLNEMPNYCVVWRVGENASKTKNI